ncbi:MAG: hypothetical protein IPK69_03260 [Phycisphaerales bacterium]|nr:MAG: hypothetical protein IPK69_03260 [Phycisphaerales bacterium]
MMKRALCVAALAGLACTTAFGQTACPDMNPLLGNANCLTNPGFEQGFDPFALNQPVGWWTSGPQAKLREVGDSISPPVAAVGTPNAITPDTGDWMVALTTDGFGGFVGISTDKINFFDPNLGYYDPVYDYSGGDVVITGRYMIPTNDPVSGDFSCIKVNIKVQNQDVATFENFSGAPAQMPGAAEGVMYPAGISGTTNGVWQTFTLNIPREAIVNQYECNRGIQPDCGCNCVPASPLPSHIKITPSRYVGDSTITTGTIYWDNFTYTELPVSTPGCVADVDDGTGTGTPDGGVTIDDLLYYLGIFNAGSVSADVDDGSGTGTPDGGVTIDDLLYYLIRFNAGC